MGKPCDCQGGTYKTQPVSGQVIHGSKIATNLIVTSGSMVSSSNKWVCIKKPKIIPQVDDKPGPCSCTVFYQTIHSACYSTVEQFTCSSTGQIYWTARRNGLMSIGENEAIMGDEIQDPNFLPAWEPHEPQYAGSSPLTDNGSSSLATLMMGVSRTRLENRKSNIRESSLSWPNTQS